jgi:hypothetical protein
VTSVEVVSTAITRLDYDAEAQSLTIVFKDGRGYVLQGVPQIEVERLANSDSPGQYWNAYMRGRY